MNHYALTNRSAFVYGFTVTKDNNMIEFQEGINAYQVFLPIGSYSRDQFLDLISSILNDTGDNTYSVTINRTTNLVTISSSGNFDLLVETVNQEVTIFSLLGFLFDKSGDDMYEADEIAGYYFESQYPLQNFEDFNFNQEAASSSINETASGRVEIVKFGNNKFLSFNMTFITNKTTQGVIKENPKGIEDAIHFLEYATTKAPIEIIYDISNPNDYETMILEGTASNRQGTGFRLISMANKGLSNHFETGNISFRRLVV